MSSGSTAVKNRKRTGSFASRLLSKQLEERSKRPSFEFAKPELNEEAKKKEEGEKTD